jgi:4-aminobutyrate aminotransferase
MNNTENIMEKYSKHVITSCVKKLEPIVIAEGRDAVVKDLNGKEYIDCWSGISVVNAGHCNPEIVSAAKEQLEKLIHCCMYVYHVIPAANLAEKLSQICGKNLQKTFFGNSGAEAIEAALKIGKKFTKKHEIIALMCSFHGRTIGTLSVTGQAGRRRYDMGPYLGGVSYAPAPYCYRCSLGQEYPRCNLQCAKMVEDVINYSSSNEVAEFIAEPILAEGGIIVPPEEYFKEVKKVLDRYGILFIDDEVQTGFGRTGKLFGWQHYGVEPDIMCMAKAIAGGLPLGTCITREDIGNAFEPGDHLSTFGGNPVSCAAALANINYIIRENLSEKSAKKGEQLMKRLNEIKGKHESIGDIRGKGLIIGIEIVKDLEKKTPGPEESVKTRDLCREDGILLGHGGVKNNVLRIQPPLVVSEEQIDRIIEVLDRSLSKVEST